MEIDLSLEFGRIDGIWWIVGLPVLSVMVFAILSPLSFLVHQLFSERRTEDVQNDTTSNIG